MPKRLRDKKTKNNLSVSWVKNKLVQCVALALHKLQLTTNHLIWLHFLDLKITFQDFLCQGCFLQNIQRSLLEFLLGQPN